MEFTITIEQMAFFTTAVIERDRLRREMSEATKALHRKKKALSHYQSIFERKNSHD